MSYLHSAIVLFALTTLVELVFTSRCMLFALQVSDSGVAECVVTAINSINIEVK